MWALLTPEDEVDEIIEVPRDIAIEAEGGVIISHPAAIFRQWSDAELLALKIIPARYGDTAPSPRHTATSTSWQVIDGEAVGTRQWAQRTITAQDVVNERERRLALGFDYDFGDGRGVHRIGTTPADLIGWDEVSKIASAAIAIGSPTLPIDIVTDTGPVQLTVLEWQSIVLAAGANRQPLWAASFVLQATDPIPANYDDDSHWE